MGASRLGLGDGDRLRQGLGRRDQGPQVLQLGAFVEGQRRRGSRASAGGQRAPGRRASTWASRTGLGVGRWASSWSSSSGGPVGTRPPSVGAARRQAPRHSPTGGRFGGSSPSAGECGATPGGPLRGPHAGDRPRRAGSGRRAARAGDPPPERLPLGRRSAGCARARSWAVVVGRATAGRMPVPARSRPATSSCRCPRRRSAAPGAARQRTGGARRRGRVCSPTPGAWRARTRRMPWPSAASAPAAARPGRACCARRRPLRCTRPARSRGRAPAVPGCTCLPRSRTPPARRRP